jgi:tetratricopeptide (TPR) repeat protein
MRSLIVWIAAPLLAQSQGFRGDLDAGHFLKVLADSEIRLRQSPEDALAHAARAQALISLLRMEEAKVEADRAIALNPNLADALLARGLARAGQALKARNFSSLRGVGESMDDLRAATQADPTLIRAWMSLGIGYEQLPWALGGSTKKALQCAESLRKVAPAKGDLLQALVHSMDGEWRKAEPFFGRALGLAPTDPEIVSGYLEALDDKASKKALGEAGKNARLVSEARRLLPGVRRSALGVVAVSDALLNGGQWEEAWKVAEAGLKEVDAPSLLRLQLGKVAARTDLHRSEGLAFLDQVLKEPLEGGSGGYASAHWRKGQILKSLGRVKEAHQEAELTLKLDLHHRGAQELITVLPLDR